MSVNFEPFTNRTFVPKTVEDRFEPFLDLPASLQSKIMGFDREITKNLSVTNKHMRNMFEQNKNQILIDSHPILGKLSRASSIEDTYRTAKLYQDIQLIKKMIRNSIENPVGERTSDYISYLRKIVESQPDAVNEQVSIKQLLQAAEGIYQGDLFLYFLSLNHPSLLKQFQIEKLNPDLVACGVFISLISGQMDLCMELLPYSSIFDLGEHDDGWRSGVRVGRTDLFLTAYECNQLEICDLLLQLAPSLAKNVLEAFVRNDEMEAGKLANFLKIFSKRGIVIESSTLDACIRMAAASNKRNSLTCLLNHWRDQEIPLEILQRVIQGLLEHPEIIGMSRFALARHPDRLGLIRWLNSEIAHRYDPESIIPVPEVLPFMNDDLWIAEDEPLEPVAPVRRRCGLGEQMLLAIGVTAMVVAVAVRFLPQINLLIENL